MKSNYLYLTTVLAFSSSVAFSAGIEKGTMEIGGSLSGDLYTVSYSTDGEEYRENSYLQLDSRVVYYLTDTWGIGASASYEKSSFEWSSGAVAGDKSFSIGPIVSYNYPFNEKVSLRIAGRAFIGEYESEENNVVDYKSTWNGYGLFAGLAVYQNDFVSIDPHIWFRSLFAAGDADYDSTAFGIGFSVSFYKNP